MAHRCTPVQRTHNPAPALLYHRFSAYDSETQTVTYLASVQYECRFIVKGKKNHCQLSGLEGEPVYLQTGSVSEAEANPQFTLRPSPRYPKFRSLLFFFFDDDDDGRLSWLNYESLSTCMAVSAFC